MNRLTGSHVRVVTVVPASDEEGSIEAVVRGALAFGDCIVVDDGSTDSTAELAAAAGAQVIRQRRNRGLGRTIRRGLEAALATDADIIVQIDADGQYDPAQIPRLTGPIEAGKADMVLGSRLDDLQYSMPRLKRFGNEAFSFVLRRLTGANVRDGQTGFRAMHRDVARECLPINEFSYTQEMVIRVAKEGYRLRSVRVDFHARAHGESRLFTNPLGFAFRGWWIIIRTLRDYHPYRFFFWPGLFLVLLAAWPGYIALDHFLDSGHISGRIGTLTAGAVAFLFGIQLMFLGLLADMIRTHTRY